ncbi:MAG: glycogen debranching protein GlgX [Gomphosphaeria aponina SAG 52.96 = DSM 107014]|uniref:Glycogen debranching protein GlgX n=1 Tax=Gomphosphaeria aponina SAG 52.96 = DSM 107014 TaxID=1521640 RepID=A0A941JPH3_9CHRO|nr:glycogen debranching protein GlgX [Gomphosphaeria aponina SAG 52.96 = DSM 107014]
MKSPDILPGKSFPLGATVFPNGVNFSIFSKSCSAMELLLFDDPLEKKPARVIRLDPKKNKTANYWHIFVEGIKAGQIYGYRAYGPFAPENGHRFDGTKVLLDPYARAIVGDEHYSREAASHPGDNCPQALKGVVVDTSTYDWEGDKPLKIPYSQSIIYELHVGGFTRNPNSGVSPGKRGTYAGLIEKIPYLQDLGVTAVELLPIHQFDVQDVKPGLKNYWGYSTIAFFAPHRGYSSRRDPLGPVDEFRDMVKAFHQAGIEVILDVVFNHTAEGNHNGPTLSFRGLENQLYYILEQDNKAYYSNYSGCGNTVKANHQVVGPMIIDCLHYWVSEMHVDGFRFDLASVMSRDSSGFPIKDPPTLWLIDTDPVLAGAKLIAEAWDAGGLYQVGSFVGDRFTEWNGQFRDDVRRFVKSDPAMVTKLAARLMGSPDIYPQPDREANRSINFITCHDGFTVNDLVSYNEKHNEANLEDSRDGANDNYSWNCEEEGKTNNREIEALRQKQIKNLLTILLVSQGTPMLLMGDEVRRTQEGNNNAYCQDNELNWFDWSLVEKNAGLLRFTKSLIHFIQHKAIFQEESFLATYPQKQPYVIWHGVRLGQPDWSDDSHTLAFTLHHPKSGEHLHIILNAYWEALTFELPPPIYPSEHWYRLVDTSLSSPDDFCEAKTAPKIEEYTYKVEPRSTVILMGM